MTTPITPHNEQVDEFFLDTPTVRAFIADVRRTLAQHNDVPTGLAALRPRFAALLGDSTWLPAEFAAPYAASGMGGGIGSWLLFRAGDRSLTLFSLVVPPEAETPVHDHLAWGFVGLYRGEQRETVYRRTDDPSVSQPLPHSHDPNHDHDYGHDHGHDHTHDHNDIGYAVLEVAEVNELQPGHFYTLLPPDGDIHAVKTTSAEASISIHLLANDTGCVVRHAFNPAEDQVRAFRSGYSNVACEPADTPASSAPRTEQSHV